MNWEAISAIAEILGVTAVIGSLIYVGRQINQNTQIARANIVHGTNTYSNQVFQLEVRHWWHDSGKIGFHHDFIRKTDRHIDSA